MVLSSELCLFRGWYTACCLFLETFHLDRAIIIQLNGGLCWMDGCRRTIKHTSYISSWRLNIHCDMPVERTCLCDIQFAKGLSNSSRSYCSLTIASHHLNGLRNCSSIREGKTVPRTKWMLVCNGDKRKSSPTHVCRCLHSPCLLFAQDGVPTSYFSIQIPMFARYDYELAVVLCYFLQKLCKN